MTLLLALFANILLISGAFAQDDSSTVYQNRNYLRHINKIYQKHGESVLDQMFSNKDQAIAECKKIKLYYSQLYFDPSKDVRPAFCCIHISPEHPQGACLKGLTENSSATFDQTCRGMYHGQEISGLNPIKSDGSAETPSQIQTWAFESMKEITGSANVDNSGIKYFENKCEQIGVNFF